MGLSPDRLQRPIGGRGGVQIEQLVYLAQQAMQAGRPDDAARLWEQILASSPEHPLALFHLAQDKLKQRDSAAALALLERAAIADPRAPGIPLNMALVHRKSGDAAAELAALDRALSLDPYFLPALLSKGAALERIGQTKHAAQVYKNALTVASEGERLPGELQELLVRARRAVDDNAAQLDAHLDAVLAAARARHPAARWDRFEAGKKAMLGQGKIYAQQPSMFHLPQLPAIPFYDPEDFDWLPALEARTGDIREEFLSAYREDNGEFVPYVDHPDSAPLNQWAELNRSPRWSVLFLWKDGQRIDSACARCPRTAAAVESVPQVFIPGLAPTVNFSVLAPRTRIPPHTGSTNVRLIVHLPLIVPEGCAYRVGHDNRVWEEGKAWVFDDTIEHEAWNGSDRPRAILMFDIWNPLLTAAERDMVSALLDGVKDFYRNEGAPVQLGG